MYTAKRWWFPRADSFLMPNTVAETFTSAGAAGPVLDSGKKPVLNLSSKKKGILLSKRTN